MAYLLPCYSSIYSGKNRTQDDSRATFLKTKELFFVELLVQFIFEINNEL